MPHPTRARASWISDLFGRGPRRPVRRAPHRRLGVEPLEDRVVPVTQLVVGGLQFHANSDFNGGTGGVYTLSGSQSQSVSIGFESAAGPDGVAPGLLRIDLATVANDPDAVGRFSLDTAAQTFTTQGEVTMYLTAVQGDGPNSRIPIFKQHLPEFSTDPSPQEFKLSDLLGFGASITSKDAQPTPFPVVDWVNLQLGGLVLSDDGAGGKVGMQGTGTISSATGVDFSQIPFISDVKVVVGGNDYVYANKDGITATGFSGQLDLSTKDYEIGGYKVTGAVAVSYSDPGDGRKRVGIGGEVALTAPAGAGLKLGNLGGTISVSMGSENGVPKFYGLSLGLKGGFKAGGLSISTLNGFGFSYNFDGPQWEVYGDVSLAFRDNVQVFLSLNTEANPGLVIKNGAVTKFNGTVNADCTFGPVTVSTSPSNGLTFTYDRDQDQFEMSGGLALKIGSGGKQFALAATLGDATDPGIVYVPDNGTVPPGQTGLQQANFGITGNLSVGSLRFSARDAGFRWVKATDTTPEAWEVHGGFGIDFGAFDASVFLGTTANPGIKVDADGLQLGGITVQLENINRGPLKLEDLKVTYTKTLDSFDLDIRVSVGIGSFVVGGEFVVVDGKFDAIELSYLNQEGIAIGETGLKLIYVDAKVKNIENPSQIAVVGKVGVVYGETLNMLGKTVNLFHAEGDLTVDADEFVLDCTAQLGAYSDDGGRTWQGALGSGEAKLDLNWRTQVYSLHVEADGVLGVFDIKGDLVFAPGREIVLLGEADVVIPTWVPFVGGKEIAGVGFFFQHVFGHGQVPTSTTLAAWLDIDLFTDITVGFEVVIDANGGTNWKLIGGSEVTGFRQALNPAGQTFTYSTALTGAIPAGTTSILARVEGVRPAPGVNPSTPRLRVQHTVNGQTETYTEDQFAAHGITVVGDPRLAGGTAKVIQITNNNPADPYAPIRGDYTLLVDVDGEGGNPYPSFPGSGLDDLDVRVVAHSTKPVFGAVGAAAPYQIALPSAAPAKTFPVTVTGNADEAYLQQGQVSVSLYRVSSADPFRRPVLVQKVTATQPDPNKSGYTATFQVPIDGLDPVACTLIAVVDDGINPPVSTDPSPAFTPVFAVTGTVTNQNGTPLAGQPVFLDYNGNFIQDANEPGALTGPNGYAFPATFPSATGLDPVPVNAAFQVVLPALSNRAQGGGFEEPGVQTQPGGYQYRPAGSPWAFADQSGLVSNGSGFGNANAPEGGQAAFVQQAGVISLTVSLGDGTYRVAFQAAQRPGNAQTFQVRITDASGATLVLNDFQPAGESYQAYATDSFPVKAGLYTVTFLGTNANGSVNGGDNTAFLDAVSVVPTTAGGKLDPVDVTPVTFDGTSPVVRPFAVREHASIKGVVFDDANSNGNPAAGRPGGGAVVYLDTNDNAVRDAGEPTVVTDAGGVYAFSDLPAGTYTVRVDLTTVGRGAAAPAYVVPAATPGSETGANAGRYTYGMSFATARPVAVTSLGVFDDNGDGLTTALTAVLYDADTQVELARLTFTPQSPGTLVGGTRYIDLPKPIILPAGFRGMIVAYGFGATADRAGNAGFSLPAWTTDDGSGRLGFTGGFQATTPNTYPTVPLEFRFPIRPGLPDGSTVRPPNPFAAGSFQYRDVPWAASPASATSHQAVLDGSGTQLVEGQDFGLLPPTVFFGRVTGSPLVNCKTQPAAPQAGVPVGLLAARVVLAVDAGGGGGNGFTGDQYATNGTAFAPANPVSIDTSGVPGAPNPFVYQTARVGNPADAGLGAFTYTLGGLSPGANYTVRLHFAEIQDVVAGQRKFNVSVNGTQVLFDFDVIAAAGGPNTAVARDFQATAGPNGVIVVAFTPGSTETPPLVSAVQVLSPTRAVLGTPKLAIDAGGGGSGAFLADQYYSGGSTAEWDGEINVNTSFYGAPEPVYHTLRGGEQFTYTLPGFEPGRPYTVRLNFCDFGVTGPGQREFDVDVNGHRALTDFDPAAAAGQPWLIGYAYDQYIDAVADANGRIVVAFTKGSKGVPIVSGIAVYEPSAVVDTALTDVQGNYALVAYRAGHYTVAQNPPATWEQVAPGYGTPVFSPTTPAVTGATAPVFLGTSVVATADFNGDGRTDLAVASLQARDASYDTLVVSVLYSQPDGSYAAEQFQAITFTYYAPLLAVGDFNGDHRPDLAVLHSGLLDGGAKTGTYLYVFLNSGDPADPFNRFQTPIKLQPGDVNPGAGEYYSAMAAGDIDGNGVDDLVLGLSRAVGQNATLVHITNVTSASPAVGTITLTPGGWQPNYLIGKVAVADVDGNGYGDILATSVSTRQSLHTLPYGVGQSVLFVARRRDATSWLDFQNYNDAYGPITGLAVGPVQPGGLPNWYTATPLWLYEDTHFDYGPTSNGNIPVYQAGLNNGDGTFGNLPPTWNYAEARPKDPAANFHLVSGLRLADMNGDHLPDLVYLYAPSPDAQSIAIRLNTGTGFDLAGPPSALVPLPASLTDYITDFAVADFDGDGLNDVFVAGIGQAGGMLYRNGTPQTQPGIARFAAAGETPAGLDFQNVQTPAGAAVHGRVFEDVNRDGTRQAAEGLAVGAVVFADLNRNGRLDPGEPQATTTAGGYYVLPGLADGAYSVGVLPAGGAGPAGDFREVTVADGSAVRTDLGQARRLVAAAPDRPARVGEPVTIDLPAVAGAAGRRLLFTAEGAAPAGLSVDPATGRITWTPTAGELGAHTVTVRVRDPFDPAFTETVPVTIQVSRASTPRVAAGADAGGSPQLRVYDGAGKPVFDAVPFGPDFRGGVRVATGDVTGDGVDDVFTAAGPGGGPRVVVYDGATGAEVTSLFAFEAEFAGGLEVAAGDVNGDGYADLVVAAGPGGGPRVRVLSGRDWSVLADFFAFAPDFRGGARVAAGDVNGDGYADIVVAAGPGGGPHVRVFDGKTGGELASYFAADVAVTGGLSVAAGDVDGDGRADLVVGAGAGGGPRVTAFAAPDVLGGTAGPGNRLADFFAADPADRGGVRVAVRPMNGDGPEAVVVAAAGRVGAFALAGPSGGPPRDLLALDPFPGFAGGVFVG